MTRWRRVLVVAAVVGLTALAVRQTARALINLTYTPVQLVQGAGAILELELGPLEAGKDDLPARVTRALKGERPGGMTLDLGDLPEASLQSLKDCFGREKTVPALLFLGKFSGASNNAPALTGEATPAGALYAGLQWFAVSKKKDGGLSLGKDEYDLNAVWAGSVTMLARAAEYAQSDERAEFPVTANAKWGRDVLLGKVSGPVNGSLAVDLNGELPLAWFVMADGGDHIFRAPGKDQAPADLTEKLGLKTRSRRAAWGDFNGDGRLDLASWDGKTLTLAIQDEAGRLVSQATGVELPECLSLAALDVGAGGKAGPGAPSPSSAKAGLLVAHASSVPELLVPDEKGAFARRAICDPGGGAAGVSPAGLFPGNGLGAAGPCLVADFDGDGRPDVVQPFSRGVLFYGGREPRAPPPVGQSPAGGAPAAPFKNPVKTEWPAEADTGPLAAAVAVDGDGDGRLDFFVSAADPDRKCAMLTNAGHGVFVLTTVETAEVDYHGQRQVSALSDCDINNDGRQGLLLVHPNLGPQVFFNRGFRCFGFARALNLGDCELKGAQALTQGTPAALMLDVNGDGVQDLVAVTPTAAGQAPGGEAWALLAETEIKAPLGPYGLYVALPRGVAGPVTVTAWDGKRCLGARVVAAGAPAFFGKRSKGPLKLEWNAGDGSPQTKTVVVLGLTRAEMGAGK